MLKRTLMILLLILLVGCVQAGEEVAPTLTETASPSPMPTKTPPPTSTSTITPAPSATVIPSVTAVPTPTWSIAGPGEVQALILLYHHVDPEKPATRYSYNVHPEMFAQQMQLLDDLGYQTITASQLITAIREGALLPPRPVVITFDDGNLSVYQSAFPIMQAHGFFGVNYVVASWLGAQGYLGAQELTEMRAAGWEVGSHSYTHRDLTLDHSLAYGEIYQSRERIYDVLEIHVDTFAYPFGSIDPYLGDRTRKWGYSGAMGLGKSTTHSLNSLFYLQRIEVYGDYDLDDFIKLLPWIEIGQ
ncbi:MAG: polysaccharide deacetylase family protein [Anaerolineales bacterium]|nr:polysaccharide deacetylase family protein [Anaerolineales bacterium]